MKTKLTIVIVNYNTKELILDCLKSIRNSSDIDFGIKVVVVDNASTDNSVEPLRKLKWITLLTSSQNRGFSQGNNLAIPHFEGEYIWFLNPDTVVDPKTISYMIHYMDLHSGVGVATPKLILPGGKLDKNCHRGFPTPWNSFCHFTGLGKLFPQSKFFSGYYLGYLPTDRDTEVDVVGGSSVLVRREIGEKIGWWDESYFMYGEDIAFTYEVKKQGHKVMYLPEVVIYHYHGASSGLKKTSQKVTTASQETRLRSAQASINAMKVFYAKHYKNKYPSFITFIVLSAISLFGLIRILKIKLSKST